MVKYIFLLCTMVCFSQTVEDSVQDTIQLKDVVFNESDKNQSLEIMKMVGKRLKKNYYFYDKVNYPISITYKSNNCTQTYTGEIAYNKLLNSSYRLDNLTEESCLIQDFGFAAPLIYLLSANLRWLDNWGGAFSSRKLKNSKYGKLHTLEDLYLITTYNSRKQPNSIEVDKNDYAILSLEGSMLVDDNSTEEHEDKKEDKNIFKSIGNHVVEIKYEKRNNKYHPERIQIYQPNGTLITVVYGNHQPYHKLREGENAGNLLRLPVLYRIDQEDDN